MKPWTTCLSARIEPGVTGQRPFAHHVDRLLRHPDGAHRVVDTPTTEPGLGDGERLALAASNASAGTRTSS